MSPTPLPASPARPVPGSGTELWLLRPGARADLGARLQAFAGAGLALVACPPEGEEAEWGAAFARARCVPLAHAPELARPASGEPGPALAERAWPALERALLHGHPRALLVVVEPVLQTLVARALGLPFERARALRIDPGRAVLLRDDPGGLVLRRSNVLAPEESSGTALPGATSEARR